MLFLCFNSRIIVFYIPFTLVGIAGIDWFRGLAPLQITEKKCLGSKPAKIYQSLSTVHNVKNYVVEMEVNKT